MLSALVNNFFQNSTQQQKGKLCWCSHNSHCARGDIKKQKDRSTVAESVRHYKQWLSQLRSQNESLVVKSL